MKLLGILSLFTLISMVRGAWWAAAVQPVILGLGAALSAIDLDLLNTQFTGLRTLLPFIYKIEEE